MFDKKRRDFSKGQVLVEFAFCMIVLMLMIYGTMRVFRWAGLDLNKRSDKHRTVLKKEITEDFGADQCVYRCWEGGVRQGEGMCYCAKDCSYAVSRSGLTSTTRCYKDGTTSNDCSECVGDWWDDEDDNTGSPVMESCDTIKCGKDWETFGYPCTCYYGTKSIRGEIITSTIMVKEKKDCLDDNNGDKLLGAECEEDECFCQTRGRYGAYVSEGENADGSCEYGQKYCGDCSRMEYYQYDCSGEDMGAFGKDGPMKQIYPDFYDPARLNAVWEKKYLFK